MFSIKRNFLKNLENKDDTARFAELFGVFPRITRWVGVAAWVVDKSSKQKNHKKMIVVRAIS